jgi:type II secretory pathway pseudopilin PulG
VTRPVDVTGPRRPQEQGFSLVEFLCSTLVLLAVSGAVFTIMSETQRRVSYQTEVQAVLQNMRIAMNTVERIVRQSANDPLSTGFAGVTVTDSTHARFRTDVTGSAAGYPDKGDPDGDTNDADEDLTVQYNTGSRSIEIVPNGGNTQSIANYISAFSLQYFDASGVATAVGANVRKIRVQISGASTLADPKTGKTFGFTLSSDVQINSRQ